MTLNILHFGKHGNMEKYAPDSRWLSSQTLWDFPGDTPVSQLAESAGDADVLVADAVAAVSAELIAALPRLKLIHSEGVAFNAFDTAAAARAGIPVCNCQGCNATAVAEQTLLLMLGLLRQVRAGDTAFRTGRQIAVKEAHMAAGDIRELSDCTVGLIGFGDIGQAVAYCLKGFNADVAYYAPHRRPAETEAAVGAAYLPLDELLQRSDILSLHLPVTPQTTGMMDAEAFARIKPGALMINTARGEIVDTPALLAALASGRLGGAGLDCVAGEPVAADNPIFDAPADVLDKILFSPHIGGITPASFRRAYAMIFENLKRIEAGDPVVRCVNAAALK